MKLWIAILDSQCMTKKGISCWNLEPCTIHFCNKEKTKKICCLEDLSGVLLRSQLFKILKNKYLNEHKIIHII